MTFGSGGSNDLSVWPPEREAQLRSLWCADYTFQDIMRIMGLTKGALSGRSYRMKLTRDVLKKPPKPVASPVLKSRKREPRMIGEPVYPAGVFPREARDVDGCRHITGHPREGDWRYCQAATIDGIWCAEHRGLVYRKPEPAKIVRPA